MKINKAKLLEAVEMCMKVVEKNAPYDLLYFDTDVISAANPFMAVEVPFELDDMKFSVNAEDFYKVLKKFPTDEITMELGEKLLLKGGKAKSNLAVGDAPFPGTWPTFLPDSYAVLPENFQTLLERCYIPNNNKQVSGVFFRNKLMASTDQSKMNIGDIAADMPSVWLMDSAVKVILGYSFDLFSLRNNVLSLRNNNGIRFNIRSLNADQYPVAVIQQYADKVEGEGELFDIPEGLLEVIKRASPMAEKASDGTFVELNFIPDGVVVKSAKSGGDYEEMYEFDCPVETMLLLDVKHLMYGLGRGSQGKIVEVDKGGTALKLLVIENEDSQHILVSACY